VGTDGGTGMSRQHHGACHGDRVRRVEAAGHIGQLHQWHHLIIQPHVPRAEAFAHIAVEQQAFGISHSVA
jgi:hypothetical protein